MLKLFFVVRSLERGGAERQLVDLIRALDRSRFETTVATFYDGGALRPELASTGVTVLSMGKRGRWDVVRFVARLVRAVRAVRPHIVIGYLNVANELALLAARLAGASAVWSIRSSYVDFRQYDALSKWAFRIGVVLSRWPDVILVNSAAGLAYHARRGYPVGRMLMIPNGVDITRFRPSLDDRDRVRREWGIHEREPLVGLAGRLDPIKDHELFLRAAALVAQDVPAARFVCVGGGEPGYADRVRALGETLGLASRLVWAGQRTDMAAVHNAFDVSVCCSVGEGFPNAVAESMACGTCCAVLDVGDAAQIVGDTGEISRTRRPADLAAAIGRAIPRASAGRSAAARQRIIDLYSLERLRHDMEATLLRLAATTA